MNELVTNALMHGFKMKKTGTVQVSVKKEKENIILMIADTGDGMGTPTIDSSREHLGLQIVKNIVLYDLKGEWKIQTDGEGTAIQIIFPR